MMRIGSNHRSSSCGSHHTKYNVFLCLVGLPTRLTYDGMTDYDVRVQVGQQAARLGRSCRFSPECTRAHQALARPLPGEGAAVGPATQVALDEEVRAQAPWVSEGLVARAALARPLAPLPRVDAEMSIEFAAKRLLARRALVLLLSGVDAVMVP